MSLNDIVGYGVLALAAYLAFPDLKALASKLFKKSPTPTVDPLTPGELLVANEIDIAALEPTWDYAVGAARLLANYHRKAANEAGYVAALQAGKCLFNEEDLKPNE